MKLLCSFLLLSGLVFGQKPSIEARLQKLEDTEEIRTLLLDYGRTLDATCAHTRSYSPRTESGSAASAA